MRKISPILFFIVITIMLSGCGLKKMAKKYETVTYKVTPEILETHGGIVNFEVKGDFPVKYFSKKATVEFQPILKFGEDSIQLKKAKIVGEKVTEGEGTVVKKKSGGSFTYTDQFEYKPEMMLSELHVEAIGSQGSKTLSFGDIKLANGIIATSERVGGDEEVEIAAHGYQKEVIITKMANLYFDYNSSNLSMSQKLNKLQQNIDQIEALKTFIEQDWKIKDVTINAWASPEGELTINTKLSDDRGKVAENWFVKYMDGLDKSKAKEMKVKVDEIKREYTLNLESKGEDFDGFMSSIQASQIPEKQAIINVIKMQPSKLQREQEIKNMTVIYAEVEAILEPLRRSEIVVSCYEPKKTDEEIAELAITDPSQLDEKELLYAATLTEDIDTKLKIYQTATTQFSDSWKGFNNAGAIQILKGNKEEATSLIEKANALAPNNAQVENNLGIIASWNKDVEKATELYEKAKQGGINVDYNMGILKIRQGSYDEALNLMNAYSCKYNIALAQVLTAKLTEAVKTIECMEEKDGDAYYLLAIIAARTANNSMMYDNLKKAFSAKPSLKEEAKKDMEFFKFFEISDFQNATK